MDWLKKMASPVKRVWVSVSSRVKSRKPGGGILELHNDVQMCGYRDVEIMWEMLRRSEMEIENNQRMRKRAFWHAFSFSNNHRARSSTGREF